MDHLRIPNHKPVVNRTNSIYKFPIIWMKKIILSVNIRMFYIWFIF